MKYTADNSIRFVTSHRPLFGDLDTYGHMSLDKYLYYVTAHRFIGMRENLGFGLRELASLPTLFYTRKVEIEYILPIVGDQEFQIESFTKSLGECSCIIDFSIVNKKGALVSKGDLHLVGVDKVTFRPTKWPQDFLDLFYTDKL